MPVGSKIFSNIFNISSLEQALVLSNYDIKGDFLLLFKLILGTKMTGGNSPFGQICQHPEQSSATEAFKRGECNRYSGPIFTVPQVGQHLQMTGAYLLEVREGGHAEIHSVSSIKLIK